MGVVSLLATGFTLVGTLLIGVGLYRRDPGAQRKMRRTLGWLARNVLRRRPPVAQGAGEIGLTIDLFAEAMRPPLAADPGAPLTERVTRLEQNIEFLSDSIRTQADARRHGDRDVRAEIAAVAQTLDGRIGEVRRLADEASVPERMEWFGLAFIVIGATLAILGG